MATVRLVVEILIGICLAGTISGMAKPWWVLWWMDTQNRFNVILIYSIPGLTLTMLYIALFNF